MSKTAIFCNCKKTRFCCESVFCDNKGAVSVISGVTQAGLGCLTKWEKLSFPVKYQTPELARGFVNIRIDQIL